MESFSVFSENISSFVFPLFLTFRKRYVIVKKNFNLLENGGGGAVGSSDIVEVASPGAKKKRFSSTRNSEAG